MGLLSGLPLLLFQDVQIVQIEPANCLASNGIVELAPANYNYVWSNSEVGALNDGLSAGIYTVTATDASTGCKDTIVVEVPNVNPLEFTAVVEQPSKCGRNTGVVNFEVTGGSGQYAYSLGGTQIFGVAPGEHYGIVIDNNSGCADTAFFYIPIVEAEGTVLVTVNQPRCNGQLGNIVLAVQPGNYFKLPYTFAIRTSTGIPVAMADSLSAGFYEVYVADADSCILPAQSFEVIAPSPIAIVGNIAPGDCADGGMIQISASGGTGPLILDWADLDGISNGNMRQHLANGQYTVTVYDSLFCNASLAEITISRNCQQADTVHLLVRKNDNNSYCIPTLPGFNSADGQFNLIGSATGSAFGNWGLNGACLSYFAKENAGFDLDLICIRAHYAALNRTDTICVLVSILENGFTKEKVNFTTQVNTTTAACGTIPAQLQNKRVFPLNVPALVGNTAFGAFSLDANNACISYASYETPQFFADSIAVAVCDQNLIQCHVICYLPSILPFTDCGKGIVAPDTLMIPTSMCEIGASACIEIPYADILNFNILDNGQLYNIGAVGCNEATVVRYAVAQIPGMGAKNNGPYLLNEWLVNGVQRVGAFGDLYELAQQMSLFDPVPGWYVDNNLQIIGGNPANNYGPLTITAANGEIGLVPDSLRVAPLGSELRFATGEHFVILKKIQTGCSDTLHIHIPCTDCPPVHAFAPNTDGNIVWEALFCTSDTIFETNIPFQDISNWVFTDQQNAINAVQVGEMAGFALDTGYHLLSLKHQITTCAYTIPFYLECSNIPINPEDKVLIFNGISPNEDGKNDFWRIIGIEQYPKNQVWVYNRNGNEVFHQAQYLNDWAGTWDNKRLPAGTYYYVVDLGDGSKIMKGYLAISY